MKNVSLFIVLMLLGLVPAHAQIDITYQEPPEPVKSMVLAPATPYVRVSPDAGYLAIFERPGMPPVKELAMPEIRIAGLRINPRTNGSSRSTYYTGIELIDMESGEKHRVTGLPGDARIENVSWAPNSSALAFTLTGETGIALWVYHVGTRTLSKIIEPVNDAIGYGLPYSWLSNSLDMLVKTVPGNRGNYPEKPVTSDGPVVQESSGSLAPSRTYQDLLKNKYDELLFEYLCTSEIRLVNVNGAAKTIGKPGIYQSILPSPDGQYMLGQAIQKPYSYLVPYYRFPLKVEIWNTRGNFIREIADIPLAEEIPIGFDAARQGPRSFEWRADHPADLYWVEAQDGGDPNRESDIRDRLYHLPAPFDGDPQPMIALAFRYRGIDWGHADMAIVYERWWKTRKAITSSFSPGTPTALRKVIFDLYYEDRYADPGDFMTTYNAFGERCLLLSRDSASLYLAGDGASPEGDKPFIDEYTIGSGKTKRLWQSEAPFYEEPVQIIDLRKNLVLTRRESKELPANYMIRNIRNNKLQALTDFKNPYEALAGVKKEVIRYKRSDGLDLKGDLYLPPGYSTSQGPLPVLMWAYPDEFKSKDAAGQVTGSPYEFARISWGSPLFWVTRGYAVFDDVSMPIVGEDNEEPNNTFVEQLVWNAEAAIDRLSDMGIGDPERVAIGGHSYGAFMTANLLAHSDLFAAGIARSGAYNRTLTPFGFQAEERTFWEAPGIYYAMSPFMHADKIQEPILLIHGEADNNSGTFPIQSERLYNAVKGHGGTCRLVLLPYESHGYRAGESILHMLWEMDTWLERYVKNK